jgi:hypothetical protein
MKLRAVIFLFVTMAFVTCKKKDDKKTESYTPSCTGAKSFMSDVFPLIKAKCWKCHNDMPDYTHIKSLSTQIKDNVISGAMPQDDKLSSEQKDIIVCWVEAGAPNN